MTTKEICRMFGVDRSTVGFIIRGKTWVHTGGPIIKTHLSRHRATRRKRAHQEAQ